MLKPVVAFVGTPQPLFWEGDKVRHIPSGFIHFVHDAEYMLKGEKTWWYHEIDREGWYYTLDFAPPPANCYKHYLVPEWSLEWPIDNGPIDE